MTVTPLRDDGPVAYVHQCELCDQEFASTHRRSRFCSTRCRQTTTSSPIYVRQCAACLTLTTFQRPLGKYCSDSCKQQAKRRKWGIAPAEGRACKLNWQRCLECSRWYVRRGHTRTCPDAVCVERHGAAATTEEQLERRRQYGRDRYAAVLAIAVTRQPRIMDCEECGQPFESLRAGDLKYCSRQCGSRASKRTRRHRIRTAPLPAESFTLREIADRDDWRCHLCGDEVPKSGGPHDLDGPTLDHLHPVALGGAHTRSNVALAHRLCNSLRGAKPLAA